jgi:hypothetical protein
MARKLLHEAALSTPRWVDPYSHVRPKIDGQITDTRSVITSGSSWCRFVAVDHGDKICKFVPPYASYPA